MNGIHEIELNGKKERVRFNQYAKAELCKTFMPTGRVFLSQAELLEVIFQREKENSALLLKELVYAGIVGDSLVTGNASRLTIEEVGEYIGEASDNDLFNIWRCFLDAQGFNLSKEEAEAEVEKKS